MILIRADAQCTIYQVQNFVLLTWSMSVKQITAYLSFDDAEAPSKHLLWNLFIVAQVRLNILLVQHEWWHRGQLSSEVEVNKKTRTLKPIICGLCSIFSPNMFNFQFFLHQLLHVYVSHTHILRVFIQFSHTKTHSSPLQLNIEEKLEGNLLVICHCQIGFTHCVVSECVAVRRI